MTSASHGWIASCVICQEDVSTDRSSRQHRSIAATIAPIVSSDPRWRCALPGTQLRANGIAADIGSRLWVLSSSTFKLGPLRQELTPRTCSSSAGLSPGSPTATGRGSRAAPSAEAGMSTDEQDSSDRHLTPDKQRLLRKISKQPMLTPASGAIPLFLSNGASIVSPRSPIVVALSRAIPGNDPGRSEGK